MKSVVMMGVAGCGKSSAGQAVALLLGLPLIEGDEFHPPTNQAKMRQGQPLTDEDRADWLSALGQALALHPAGTVLTCSALKRAYRNRLRQAAPGLCFAFLEIDQSAALQRVAARPGHLFPPSLVQNQFATLESPVGEDGVLRVDAQQPLAALSSSVAQWLREQSDKEFV